MDTERMSFAPEPGFVSSSTGTIDGLGFPSDLGRGHPLASSRNAPRVANREGAGQFRRQTASYDCRYVAENGRLIVTTAVGREKNPEKLSQRNFRNSSSNLNSRATHADSGGFSSASRNSGAAIMLARPYKQLKITSRRTGKRNGGGRTNIVAFCNMQSEILEPPPAGSSGHRANFGPRRRPGQMGNTATIELKEIASECNSVPGSGV